MGRVASIINPVAGAGKAMQYKETLSDFGPVSLTQEPYHATQLAQGLVRQGYEQIAVAGGDGTMREVAQGLEICGFEATLAPIAAGRGNDASFGWGCSKPDEIISALATGSTIRKVDVCSLEREDAPRRIFLNAADAGFAGIIAAIIEPSKGSSPFVYVWKAITKALGAPEFPVRLWTDSGSLVGSSLSVSLSNGPRVAGFFFPAPWADPTDGIIEVTKIAPLPRLIRLPYLLLGVLKHLKGKRAVEQERGRSVRILLETDVPAHLDGEPVTFSKGTFDVHCHQQKLRVLTPYS